MATRRRHRPKPAAQRAKEVVQDAVARSRTRLGREYPQLGAHGA